MTAPGAGGKGTTLFLVDADRPGFKYGGTNEIMKEVIARSLVGR
jgi:alkylation response protein AidB-like acyl-CoA dehydrogenase